MIKDRFIIFPKKGFGHLKFGMYKDDVIKILGEPTEVEDPDEDGDIKFIYENKGINFLIFEKEEEYRLTYIELNKMADAILLGKKIFNLSFKQIEELLRLKGFTLKYENCIDDRESGDYQELYISKEISFDFWFNKSKKLDEITFSVYINEQDEVEWPD